MKPNSIIFLENTKHYPEIFREGFVRDRHGLMEASDWLLSTDITIIRSLLGAIPILGNILGAGRLYSVWYTSDEDWKKQVVWHTIFGILEVLGLGILALALKILLTTIYYLLRGLWNVSFMLIEIFSALVPNYPVLV
ncbi:conserved hypothetical protein [Chlamydia pneumoniae LPCoLN]|uniref:hypothetical protein n=1 Tax=Chlamydia pneumoniae TaxID=83558 RepID=UPI0001BD9CEE|nr:hypothetical protein [Chlamydia pneumoniae]ACZ33201.1 conserved hypothetical protein [Chlamydia pneumoniae LPCoLN]ETR80117.1 hypothetical protein X556_0569 [Chlamydia pneumoniae B21]